MKPPPSPFAPRPNATEQALQAAAFALQANRPAEAERIAGEVSRRNRSDPRAAQLYGYALLMQGKAKDAIPPLERAFKQTRDPAVETQLAMALREAGQTEQALERFQHAVSRKPVFPPAFLEYSVLLLNLDRTAEAIDLMKHGAALAPEFGDLSLQLARELSGEGELEASRDVLLRAHAAAPKNCDVLFSLARTHQAMHDFERAAETYRLILKMMPQDGASKVGLGICLLELGREDEALVQLREASRMSDKLLGEAIVALIDAGRGRFWLKPSEAKRMLRGETK
ncbi:MAG: tetratricopeptide repeat protein [Xanthobacteraceae bacterium]|uniref:tetratricopeptide repeat protein n=1 Tax=Pseudolabrys sp. TaxID=1960880 RepID=UPI003D0CE0CB